MSRLRKLLLSLRLLYSGVCPKHGKVIEFLDSGCAICKQNDINRRARGAVESLVQLRAMNGVRRG